MRKKYRVISIDNVMSELRNHVVYWLDRTNQDMGYAEALTLSEWLEICDHDNSDNRFEFYVEEEKEN